MGLPYGRLPLWELPYGACMVPLQLGALCMMHGRTACSPPDVNGPSDWDGCRANVGQGQVLHALQSDARGCSSDKSESLHPCASTSGHQLVSLHAHRHRVCLQPPAPTPTAAHTLKWAAQPHRPCSCHFTTSIAAACPARVSRQRQHFGRTPFPSCASSTTCRGNREHCLSASSNALVWRTLGPFSSG